MSTTISIGPGQDYITAVVEALRIDGYALVHLVNPDQYESTDALTAMEYLLQEISTPIRIFDRFPTWRPIGVDLTREPSRSEGTGVSPLHMDFVNAENPPDIVLLYCERSDPNGGGETILAPTSAAKSLKVSIADRLRKRIYHDGRVVGLHNIGEDINPFAVIADDEYWAFRFTEQLLLANLDSLDLDAITALHEALRAQMITIPVLRGEGILIDQHKILHGRLALGSNQELVPEDHRRLIWQRFGRAS